MIAYNMRYRGAMEYDKFILNFLQYYNEVNEMLYEELENVENTKSFQKICDNVTAVYEALVGTETTKGFSERLQESLINMKEV